MIGILTDVTKCIGCHKCVEACAKENNLGPHIPNWRHNGDGLGSNRWTAIIKAEKGRFVRKQCRHCLKPACVSACIVGALKQTKEGAVIYDPKRCMGCRYCMMACPFGIPRYSWENVVPYIRKCKLCYDNRILQGKQPACTEACPAQATIFGNRDDLLAEARRRIQNNPGKYLPQIYGEQEVGGTNVLYISDVPLSFLGWSEKLENTAPPDLTWGVLKKVPFEFIGMGVIMASIYWITGRRRHVAQAQAEAEIQAAIQRDKQKSKQAEAEQEKEKSS